MFSTTLTTSHHLCVSLVHGLPSNFCQFHFNIISSPTRSPYKCSLSFSFPYQNPIFISFLPSTFHMHCPSRLPWFDRPNVFLLVPVRTDGRFFAAVTGQYAFTCSYTRPAGWQCALKLGTRSVLTSLDLSVWEGNRDWPCACDNRNK